MTLQRVYVYHESALLLPAISTGRSNFAIAIDPQANRAYTANFYNASVSVRDLATDSVIADIPVGMNPSSSVHDGATGRAYVANANSNSVSVIDEVSNTVTGVLFPIGDYTFSPGALAPDPNTARLYAAGNGGGSIVVIDTPTNTVVDTLHGTQTADISSLAFNAQTRTGFVTYGGTDPGIVDAFNRAQTLAFGPLPARTFGDPDFAVTATASSGLPVTLTAAGACTVSGTTVHLTQAGICTLTAHQAGDSNVDPATAAGSFSVAAPTTGPAVSAPQFVNFPDTAVGQQSDPVYFNVTNSGGSPLHITAVTLTGSFTQDYAVTLDNRVGTLAPPASCTIGIRFAPTQVGGRPASLSIQDDAVDSPQTVGLVATGTAAPRYPPRPPTSPRPA